MSEPLAPNNSCGKPIRPRSRFVTTVRVCILLVIGSWLAWRLLTLGTSYLGAGRNVAEPLVPGPLYPAKDDGPVSSPQFVNPRQTVSKTARGQAAIQFDATGNLHVTENGKPAIRFRAAISRLYIGKDVEDFNQCLRSVKPWKESGSTWVFHPSGNYDFDEVDLVALLYLFRDQPEKLHLDTAKYIVDTLLIESGGTPRPKTPRTLGLVAETENHILMTEGTRYLKNQWLFERGDPDQRGKARYDNDRNGLGAWLLNFLRGIEDTGFYEFNSIPYLSYSVRAVLNLEAFPANGEIRSTARHILDVANWQYALGSLDLRRCAPFRRQPQRAGITGLQEDEHTPFMQVWTGTPDDPPPVLWTEIRAPAAHFRVREEVLAEAMPYRLPETVRRWVLEKPDRYFVRFGHGRRASPELYSGGPDYLISAGGVNRGRLSMIAARPISLLLRDGAKDLRDCFHLSGRGRNTEWNNTGVCDRFACGNGAVHVPEGKQAAASMGAWVVYGVASAPALMIAIHEVPGIALLALFPDWKDSPEQLLHAVTQANPQEEELAHTFHWPDARISVHYTGGGTVSYDVNAGKSEWIISAIDGQAVDRDYDHWPQMDGAGPKIRFTRARMPVHNTGGM